MTAASVVCRPGVEKIANSSCCFVDLLLQIRRARRLFSVLLAGLIPIRRKADEAVEGGGGQRRVEADLGRQCILVSFQPAQFFFGRLDLRADPFSALGPLLLHAQPVPFVFHFAQAPANGRFVPRRRRIETRVTEAAFRVRGKDGLLGSTTRRAPESQGGGSRQQCRQHGNERCGCGLQVAGPAGCHGCRRGTTGGDERRPEGSGRLRFCLDLAGSQPVAQRRRAVAQTVDLLRVRRLAGQHPLLLKFRVLRLRGDPPGNEILGPPAGVGVDARRLAAPAELRARILRSGFRHCRRIAGVAVVGRQLVQRSKLRSDGLQLLGGWRRLRQPGAFEFRFRGFQLALPRAQFLAQLRRLLFPRVELFQLLALQAVHLRGKVCELFAARLVSCNRIRQFQRLLEVLAQAASRLGRIDALLQRRQIRFLPLQSRVVAHYLPALSAGLDQRPAFPAAEPRSRRRLDFVPQRVQVAVAEQFAPQQRGQILVVCVAGVEQALDGETVQSELIRAGQYRSVAVRRPVAAPSYMAAVAGYLPAGFAVLELGFQRQRGRVVPAVAQQVLQGTGEAALADRIGADHKIDARADLIEREFRLDTGQLADRELAQPHQSPSCSP